MPCVIYERTEMPCTYRLHFVYGRKAYLERVQKVMCENNLIQTFFFGGITCALHHINIYIYGIIQGCLLYCVTTDRALSIVY